MEMPSHGTLGIHKKDLELDPHLEDLKTCVFTQKEAPLNLNNNPTSQLSLNYMPALTKQHDYTLANIYIYQAQPGLVVENYEFPLVKSGEIGESIDVFYNIKKGTLLGGKIRDKTECELVVLGKFNIDLHRPFRHSLFCRR